jgi:HPt (histidine-containing phosphotransfer) domain-containing protein
LIKYFKPLGWQEEDMIQRTKIENELQEKLIGKFVQNNRDKFGEITAAIKSGDIKSAHRLAHTLKGNAGQLKKILLQKSAAKVEEGLKSGENLVKPEHLEVLRFELEAVMAELTPLIERVKENKKTNSDIQPLTPERIREIFDELQPLLKDKDSDSLQYIDELRLIESSEKLISQMEDFDFKPAIESLNELMKIHNNGG